MASVRNLHLLVGSRVTTRCTPGIWNLVWRWILHVLRNFCEVFYCGLKIANMRRREVLCVMSDKFHVTEIYTSANNIHR
jgi:hypothetical protein